MIQIKFAGLERIAEEAMGKKKHLIARFNERTPGMDTEINFQESAFLLRKLWFISRITDSCNESNIFGIRPLELYQLKSSFIFPGISDYWFEHADSYSFLLDDGFVALDCEKEEHRITLNIAYLEEGDVKARFELSKKGDVYTTCSSETIPPYFGEHAILLADLTSAMINACYGIAGKMPKKEYLLEIRPSGVVSVDELLDREGVESLMKDLISDIKEGVPLDEIAPAAAELGTNENPIGLPPPGGAEMPPSGTKYRKTKTGTYIHLVDPGKKKEE